MCKGESTWHRQELFFLNFGGGISRRLIIGGHIHSPVGQEIPRNSFTRKLSSIVVGTPIGFFRVLKKSERGRTRTLWMKIYTLTSANLRPTL